MVLLLQKFSESGIESDLTLVSPILKMFSLNASAKSIYSLTHDCHCWLQRKVLRTFLVTKFSFLKVLLDYLLLYQICCGNNHFLT